MRPLDRNASKCISHELLSLGDRSQFGVSPSVRDAAVDVGLGGDFARSVAKSQPSAFVRGQPERA